MIRIDAHSHLWLKQDTTVDGKRILSLKNGRSIFMDEEVQMVPPFMIDSVNSAEVFLSNMNYAQVGAAVVVQEVIDGNQNEYLTQVQQQYPDRFFCMGMAWNLDEAKAVYEAGLKGIAFPGHRMHEPLQTLMPVFKFMEEKGMILSMCLGDDEAQIAQMAEVIQECPKLKVAIGHFGMPTTPSFKSQVMLARQGDNVMIESGGITWLYNPEFYPYPTAVRRILEAADWVGMERLMWGSDYPRTITAITYRMSYDFVEKSSELSDAEKGAFLGQNAQRFYGFKNLPELPYIKNMSE
ncbi:amidohydrolase family protein [uncultured Prevotella sp.]|jgi:predicted TIM-barrel fold metal-dependent hydrolase|uniref:amidohydrolase family protein n=1 Tax=uncultured Prevotella sp. TaxID=159272 RepID=UPI0025D8C4F4|nr:amidohydrolase family protein [uncultured Prevotella sp.]